MTTEYRPLFARTDRYLTDNAATIDRSVNGGSADRSLRETGPRHRADARRDDEKAIELLDDDPEGFTLQVEGASIDKRDHSADVCGQIGELLGFDEAIGVAQEFQRNNPDTLIIVSADHSHTSQIISAGSKPAPGASYATVQTVDGAPMRVAYGTAGHRHRPGVTADSQAHTGAQVPVWASGPQAANIQGTIDQTDIFAVVNGKIPSRASRGSDSNARARRDAPPAPAGERRTASTAATAVNGLDGCDGRLPRARPARAAPTASTA